MRGKNEVLRYAVMLLEQERKAPSNAAEDRLCCAALKERNVQYALWCNRYKTAKNTGYYANRNIKFRRRYFEPAEPTIVPLLVAMLRPRRSIEYPLPSVTFLKSLAVTLLSLNRF